MSLRSLLRRGPRDATCLLAAARDDPAAFARFYEAYAERVLVFLTRRTMDPDLALDLTAETFAIALAQRARFRGNSEEEERAWLFAIARSQWARWARRGTIERRAVERYGIVTSRMSHDELARAEEIAELDRLRPQLLAAVDDLPIAQREAVQMRVIEELDYGEMAYRLGVTEQVARARVSRGLRALALTVDHPGILEAT